MNAAKLDTTGVAITEWILSNAWQVRLYQLISQGYGSGAANDIPAMSYSERFRLLLKLERQKAREDEEETQE